MRTIKDVFGFYREVFFDDMLKWERKRTERSQKPFAMITVEIRHLVKAKEKKFIKNIAVVLDACFREIDIKGWYKDLSIVGIICPDVPHKNVEAIKRKLEEALGKALPPQFAQDLRVSYICFPEAGSNEVSAQNLAMYPEFKLNSIKRVVSDSCKRSMDIIVASMMLAVALPIMIAVAVGIKINSPGPVFFKQKRVGFGGRAFTLLKFRSMKINNDDSAHKEFVKNFIKTKNSEITEDTKSFKIVKDPRVTPIGRFIRKTSIDELPQLLNVLSGEMSLVGPRPPIPYEVDEYHIWHRRRVMEVKPGITGFWQVHGRSITSFETMVRMDLYYIKYRNLLLDIMLILKTPRSLLKGAY